MATILITGGTGMIGTHLSKQLVGAGHQVIILTRNTDRHQRAQPGISYANWDFEAQVIDANAISGTDCIIHLAGAGVADQRWNQRRKEEIVSSRVKSSQLLIKAMQTIPNNIQTIISASGIGWYGADTAASLKDGFNEEAPADREFLGETCRLWEEHIQPVTALGKRLVIFRIGIVLSHSGGALKEFIKPLKAGVAAILGHGRQNISWVHIDDLCSMMQMAMEDSNMQGVYNAVAPEVTNNQTLTLSLAKAMRGRFFIPIHVPAFVLKLILGEMSVEVLKSAKVNSFKIQSAGFHHSYPTLQKAIEQLRPLL